MKPADFKDVPFVTKAKSTSYFCYQVAFQEQKPIKPEFITDFKKTMQHALDHHYCVSFIPCPFDFNFESLLSHFKWCCKFLYFNFSETMMQFDVFKRMKSMEWSEHELHTLLKALYSNKDPYSYPLTRYSGEIKFALLKLAPKWCGLIHHNLQVAPKPDTREVEQMLAAGLDRLNAAFEKGPKPVTRNWRFILFPETNTDYYYKMVFGRLIPWCFAMIAAWFLFSLAEDALSSYRAHEYNEQGNTCIKAWNEVYKRGGKLRKKEMDAAWAKAEKEN
jgi:hypothetical protein